MESFAGAWHRISILLNSGIAGSEFTPLKLLTVIALTWALIWITRRAEQLAGQQRPGASRRRYWFTRGPRYHRAVRAHHLGALVILQGAGINLTSLNVLVGAIGVGLGFGLQNITSNFFSGLIILLGTADQNGGPRRDRRTRSVKSRRSGRGRRPRHRRERRGDRAKLPVRVGARDELEPAR